MYCYQCGMELNAARNVCPHCGADVTDYKHIVRLSNRAYNEGLEKAAARDLSGAVTRLRQALRYSKDNVDARNLLGLVYYEMGEIVPAICEWVISMNLHPEENPASEYMERLKGNQNKLDTLNQTVKKYNQALEYCYQGNTDLAVIQLRKALSMNPHFLKARQLLALLYLNARDTTQAARELRKCQNIDGGNTLTLRYLKELEKMDSGEGIRSAAGRTGSASDVFSYNSGSDTVIQPVGSGFSFDSSLLSGSLINMLIGALVGAAMIGFLIMPARIQAVRTESTARIREISEQADSRTTELVEKEQQIRDLTAENERLSQSLNMFEGDDGETSVRDLLDQAVNIYLNNTDDPNAVMGVFTRIDPEIVSNSGDEAFVGLYRSLESRLTPQLRSFYYNQALAQLSSENPNYDQAVETLEQAYACTGQEDEIYPSIVFYLAEAYYQRYLQASEQDRSLYLGDMKKAAGFYDEIAALYPQSQHKEAAERRLSEITVLGLR